MENHDDEPEEWSEDFARYLAIEQQPRFHDLDLHVSFDPDLAWPLILELLAEVPEDLVYNVGCGPLENFVNKHGAAFVEQLEAETRTNERFRRAVIEVNLPRGRLPEAVEARLVAAFGPRFELLPPLWILRTRGAHRPSQSTPHTTTQIPMAQPLPAFRYHPDPLATGTIVASDEPCASCGQARGYIHRGPSSDVCPWCVAGGEAASAGFESVTPFYVGAFAWEMVLQHSGYSRWPMVPQAVADEVAHRTPGFPTYQDALWWTHCDDAGAFIGVVGDLPAETFADESARDFVDEIKRCEDITDDEWEWHVSTPGAEHHKTIYVFRCLHCGKLGGYADCT